MPLPTPYPTHSERSKAHGTQTKPTISAQQRANAAAARQKQKAEWALLTLRQQWADEAFMLAHLKAAALRSPERTEPATVARMSKLLRRAGVYGAEAREAVGCDLPDFLQKNPGLPLWAAVALVLESCGRFTPDAFALMGVLSLVPTGHVAPQ